MSQKENITEIIEPSAGNGSFSKQIENCIAYDLYPEDDSIIKQDFLELKMEYKKGRLFIGNPPFGDRGNLITKFYKKCIHYGDYIAFILPISQLNNSIKLYEFDLIYSENLGIKDYSDRKIHCCLNIYKRPLNSLFNKNIKKKSILIDIIHYDRGRSDLNDVSLKINNYDLGICAWGNVGKEVEYLGQYSSEFYIIIKDKKYKSKIIQLLKNIDWKKEYFMTSAPRLKFWQIYDYIDKNVEIIYNE